MPEQYICPRCGKVLERIAHSCKGELVWTEDHYEENSTDYYNCKNCGLYIEDLVI